MTERWRVFKLSRVCIHKNALNMTQILQGVGYKISDLIFFPFGLSKGKISRTSTAAVKSLPNCIVLVRLELGKL